MKMFVKFTFLLSVIFSLSACVSAPTYGPSQSMTPPVAMEMSDTAPISIILPKDNSLYELQDGVFNVMKLAWIQEREDIAVISYNGRHPYSFWGYQYSTSEDTIILFKVRGRNNNTGSSKDRFGYISYEFKQEQVDEGDNLRITLTPVKKEKGFYNGECGVKEFTKQEYLEYLSTLSLHCKFEIDSEYQAESIQANFDRNFEQENFYYISIPNKPVEKYTIAYNLIYKGQKKLFSAITTPYRNGSKTIIRYDVPVSPTSENEINVSKIVADINGEFRRIVEE